MSWVRFVRTPTGSVAYSVELVLLNKPQISGGGAKLHCYRILIRKSFITILHRKAHKTGIRKRCMYHTRSHSFRHSATILRKPVLPFNIRKVHPANNLVYSFQCHITQTTITKSSANKNQLFASLIAKNILCSSQSKHSPSPIC